MSPAAGCTPIQVQQRLPWLYKLYRDQFLELASRGLGGAHRAGPR